MLCVCVYVCRNLGLWEHVEGRVVVWLMHLVLCLGDWENILTVLSQVNRVNILKTNGSVSGCVLT